MWIFPGRTGKKKRIGFTAGKKPDNTINISGKKILLKKGPDTVIIAVSGPLYDLILLFVGGWRDPINLRKNTVEGTETFKACQITDFSNRKIGGCKQFFRVLYTQGIQICAEITPDFLGKETGDLVFAHTKMMRQIIESQRLHKVL